jgi:gamma-glutamyltranspeptidase/glutathione hydrolase
MKKTVLTYLSVWCLFALNASLQFAVAANGPGQAGIATAHPLATKAGYEILEAGGNAFDAAVAVSAALGVVEPYSSGLGGGAFWLLHVAEEQHDVFVDARETAPGAATADMYLDDDGNPVRRASFNGPLAAGIPGQAAGLIHLAERYGRLSLAESLAPAIRYAREGVPVHGRMRLGLGFRREAADEWPAFGKVYYPDGEVPEEGDLLRQPDLAETLSRLAEDGFAGFYRGETARMLVGGVREAGGIWTLEDLAGYRIVERDPIGFFYRGVRVVSAPLPSSGGIMLANIFNILDGYELAELGAVARIHLIIEAMRLAYRDRARYLGDSDFAEVPVDRLIHPYYAAGQRISIRSDRATPSAALEGFQGAVKKGTDTTHFSVLDKDGNRVAGTMSINTWYGSAFMAPGTGVILNNEMDDFAIKPGLANYFGLTGYSANSIEPGKRMLSSMSPTFLESRRGIAILGTPGGSRIITMVLLAAMAWMDGADAQAMVDLKRYHHQFTPDQVEYEEGAFSLEEGQSLEALGHGLKKSRRAYGNMNVVTWDFESGEVEAVSDPRGEGEGRVY